MRKNILFYFIAFALLLLIFFFFNRDYRELIRYSELTNRTNIIHSSFQNLSTQIKDAAVLNPDLVKASNTSKVEKLFFADSQSVIQQLELLKATVRDSVNIEIAEQLDVKIRSELPWILKSNVPDSIIQHKSPQHIASFLSIDSLITLGIQRTNFLLEYRKKKLDETINKLRAWMILFIVLSCILLIYTTTNLFRQKSKTKRKEKELEITQRQVIKAYKEKEAVLNRISDGVVSVDNDWRYTFLNDAAMATHPLGRQETLGKVIWDIHPEMNGTIFWDKYHEAMLTRKVVEVDSYYPSMNIWFSVKVYPSTDGLTIFYKDVTESKKSELEIIQLNTELEGKVLERTNELLQSKNQLAETLERISFLATIADNIQDPVISTDNNAVITRWNKAAEKLLEWTSEEVIGKNVREIFKTNFPYETREHILKSLQKKGFWKGEVIYHTKSGGPLNVLSTISYLKDAAGNVTGNLVLVRDISERKKAEEALSKLNAELEQRVIERSAEISKSEKRFRALIENNYDVISLADETFNIFYRSPSSARVTGWTDEELKNTDRAKYVHPDDIEKAISITMESVANPGKPIPFLVRNLHKNGHYIWVEGLTTNMLQDENVKAMVFNFRDVTERVEAEEKLIKSEKIYKTIGSSIPGSVICLLDREYRYLLIEGDMLEKLGYSRDKLLGNKAEDVLPPEVFAGVQEEFKRVLNGETITRETNRNGYDIIARLVPLKDENNIVYTIMAVSIDVTQLKNAQRDIAELNRGLEEKIIQRTAQLESANKELESFSYSVSHDLRAPLRIIDGFGQILMEDYSQKLDEEGQETVKVIMKSAQKMGQLIDDLLSFSKLGRSEMRVSKVNMNDLVKEVLIELETSGITIPSQLKVNKLKIATGDSNLLKQVWINLISNALKYSSGKKDPVIEIGMAEKKGKPVYYVKDNGAGFDMQYADKLFGVFQRLHNEEEFTGTGVGLALVQRIILRHEGTIWAEAKENEGATFYFTLS